jgi:hypothetical protein
LFKVLKIGKVDKLSSSFEQISKHTLNLIMHKQIKQAFKLLKWALKNNNGLSKSNVNSGSSKQEQARTQTLCFSGGIQTKSSTANAQTTSK